MIILEILKFDYFKMKIGLSYLIAYFFFFLCEIYIVLIDSLFDNIEEYIFWVGLIKVDNS